MTSQKLVELNQEGNLTISVLLSIFVFYLLKKFNIKPSEIMEAIQSEEMAKFIEEFSDSLVLLSQNIQN